MPPPRAVKVSARCLGGCVSSSFAPSILHAKRRRSAVSMHSGVCPVSSCPVWKPDALRRILRPRLCGFGITSDRLAMSVVAAHQDHILSTCRAGRCRCISHKIPTAHCAMRVPDVRVFLRRSCDVTGPRGELLRREAGTTSLQPNDRNWLLCSIVLWEIRFWKTH